MKEREMSLFEFKNVVNGNLPVFDQFEFLGNGLAKVKKDEKYGVVNSSGKIIVELLYEEIETLEHGTIILRNGGTFEIRSRDGLNVTNRIFSFKEEARVYSAFFDSV